MAAALTLENQTRRVVPLARLKRLLLRAVSLQGFVRGSWTVTFVDDKAMAELHARTMNLPNTTDVLTFDLRDQEPGSRKGKRKSQQLDLDTVICVDEAGRRARELGHALWQELLLYAVHSLLHVSGYDDLTAGQAQRMHRREDELLVRLGIGPVYAPPQAQGTSPVSPPARSPRARRARASKARGGANRLTRKPL